MKEIRLTQGKVALVDDEDFEYLNSFKWWARKCKGQQTFYAVRHQYPKSIVFMHNQILGIQPGNIFCDHIDLNGLNNQKYNLRIATKSQNNANKRSSVGSFSKFRGVSFHKRDKVWQANAGKDGKQIYIGVFKTETEAALAYNIKAIELHGEFAKLNIL